MTHFGHTSATFIIAMRFIKDRSNNERGLTTLNAFRTFDSLSCLLRSCLLTTALLS
jgi:hypothetical protein